MERLFHVCRPLCPSCYDLLAHDGYICEPFQYGIWAQVSRTSEQTFRAKDRGGSQWCCCGCYFCALLTLHYCCGGLFSHVVPAVRGNRIHLAAACCLFIPGMGTPSRGQRPTLLRTNGAQVGLSTGRSTHPSMPAVRCVVSHHTRASARSNVACDACCRVITGAIWDSCVFSTSAALKLFHLSLLLTSTAAYSLPGGHTKRPPIRQECSSGPPFAATSGRLAHLSIVHCDM